MADLWVKFHSALTKGSKRALSRASRFVFLELCLQARELDGSLEIRSDLDLPAAVYDIIGGNMTEIAEAVSALVGAGMLAVEDIDGARFLSIPSWERWNRPDTSSDRVKRHRERKRGVTHETLQAVTGCNDVNALEERRGEERRAEEKETRARAPAPKRGADAAALCDVLASRAELFGTADLIAVAARLEITLEGEPKADRLDRRQIARELVADVEAYSAKYAQATPEQRVAQLSRKLAWILGDVASGRRKDALARHEPSDGFPDLDGYAARLGAGA